MILRLSPDEILSGCQQYWNKILSHKEIDIIKDMGCVVITMLFKQWHRGQVQSLRRWREADRLPARSVILHMARAGHIIHGSHAQWWIPTEKGAMD